MFKEDKLKVKKLIILSGSVCLVLVLIISVLLSACAKQEAAAPTSAPPTATVYEWRLQSHSAPTEPTYSVMITDYVKRIEEMSDGRIEIEMHSAGELLPSKEILPSVAKGVIEMGTSAASYSSGLMPVVYTTLIPMGPRSAEDCAIIWEKGWGDILRAAYDEQGVKLLTMAIMTDIPLYSTVPVRTVDDFKGMKIRTHGATALFLEQLGASTTYIPGEEVYMALSTGTVDAATWGGFNTTYPKKWYEVAPYIIQPSLVPMFQQQDFMINKALFEGLPTDLQVIIQTSADLAMWECRMVEALGNDAALAKMLAAGNEIITLPAESVAKMTEAARVVWDDLASRSPRSYEAMKIITDVLRSKGYTDYVIEERNIEVKK